MALTNIELYEALKKDVSEESARMIAEVVPKAGDLATKADLAVLASELKSYIDLRLLRFTAAIVVPMVLAMLGTVIAVVVKL
jgi:hypothetical protein